ncbi:MAG: ABC transporter permease [Myxococcales bacterium]|nr:ABC transporter permease [Myxococcales bacterium]
MFRLLPLALRNVTRSKARTGLTVGMIFFGVMMSLTLSGFVMGVGETMVEEAVKARVGALEVHRKGYFEERDKAPLKLDVEQGGPLEQALASTPHVTGVTPRILFAGLLTNGRRGTMVLATAVDPTGVFSALPLADKYVEGSYLKPKDANGLIVGTVMGHSLALKPGGTAMLQAQAKDGRQNALDLELRGTMMGQNPLESKRNITVPLAFAQSLLGMEGRVTEYVLAVDAPEHLDATAAALRAKLGPGYEVQTWEELRPPLRDARFVQRAILGAVSFVFLIIAVFGVANTMLMTVMERTREIGTMLAVGMTRAQIAALFLLEAAVQALLGASLGVAVATAIIQVAASRGGFFVSMGAGQGGQQVMPMLLTGPVVIAVVAAVLGALLASVSPALRAARLRPVEALSST